MNIANAFDSHVHWQGTGSFASRLKLHSVRTLEDLKSLKIQTTSMREEWLLGFGWDQHHFTDELKLHRKTLDELYPGVPVTFTRVDAHSFWVSTEALKRAGLYSQNIPS